MHIILKENNKMRKILGIVAVAVALGAASLSCKKAPYQQLADTVDSVNTVMSQGGMQDFPDGCKVSYDEATNTVKFNIAVPLHFDESSLTEPQREQFQTNFVTAIINGIPSLAQKIEANHSAVLLTFDGTENSKYEIMTDSERFNDIYSLSKKLKVVEAESAAADSIVELDDTVAASAARQL